MEPQINTVYITGKDDKIPTLAIRKPKTGEFTIYVHVQYIYFNLTPFVVNISVTDQNDKMILQPSGNTFDFSNVKTDGHETGISEVSFYIVIQAAEVADSNRLTAHVKIGDEEYNVSVFLTGGSNNG
ncbi:hypothetical protein [Furfurilactobacillus curtus]|uniref:DUF2479 domain-containing protein n=1 Tax=Furfurilactobacillus curtus TaxID=1746200 RepID=A0ABQ5JMG4_9LACO